MDRDLVEAARDRDREAYADLIRVRGDRLYALAHRILRDVDRAEDALQEALIAAWRDLPGLREPDRFDAWLHRLVVNACYVEARGERRRIAHIRVLDLEARTVPDIAQSLATKDDLDHAFRGLSPEHRAVVVLHHHLGYPLTEIASTLGIPVGTARSRLHYGVRQLRAALDPEHRTITTSKERSA